MLKDLAPPHKPVRRVLPVVIVLVEQMLYNVLLGLLLVVPETYFPLIAWYVVLEHSRTVQCVVLAQAQNIVLVGLLPRVAQQDQLVQRLLVL